MKLTAMRQACIAACTCN